MIERRKANRKVVDLEVRKHSGSDTYYCRACEISPTGIRLKRIFDIGMSGSVVDIEVPLVEGGLTTAVSARRIWRKGGYEAFEFVDPSFAQQIMLERLFGNYTRKASYR
ncbi:MAG: PilZ domain-containing protein [Proteobacteria bacterium]|nr:PilZ domain-containing protein [Pseudomonadota bacterium]